MQKKERIEQIFMQLQMELDDLLYNDQVDILSWTMPTDSMLLVRTLRKSHFHRRNLGCNCIVGSHVTAYARIYMHEQLLKVEAKGGMLVYTDTYVYLII